VSAAPHALLNALSPDEARAALARCCGSGRWVAGMLARRPFASPEDLHAAADDAWRALGRDDFLEAFAAHPRIGETSGEKAGGTWSADEQARAAGRSADDAAALRALNQAYAERFGYIFIICATGKTAPEILAALRARLPNDGESELAVAAAEQAKITRIRLERLAP